MFEANIKTKSTISLIAVVGSLNQRNTKLDEYEMPTNQLLGQLGQNLFCIQYANENYHRPKFGVPELLH